MKVLNYRDGELISAFEASAPIALWRLIKYELFFGGVIIAMDDTSVCVRTLVFNKCDETTLQMTAQEMEDLMPALIDWQKSRSSEPIPDIKGNPLLLRMAAGPIMGGMFNKGSARTMQLLVHVMLPYLGEHDATVFALLYATVSYRPTEDAFDEVTKVLGEIPLGDSCEVVGLGEQYRKLSLEYHELLKKVEDEKVSVS